MKLRELGERKAIELVRSVLHGEGVDIGKRQDDCAVIDFGDTYLLMTTDMISSGTHFPRSATPWQIGWHAAAVNFSDIAAMGGAPICMVISLGLPGDREDEWVMALMEGADVCAQTFGASIVGGDTKEAGCVTITGCALGQVSKTDVLLRTGARPNDIIAVTGELGRTAAAYHKLTSNPGDGQAVKYLLEILPRVREGLALSHTRAVTSCMDISDGLAWSLYQTGQLNGTASEIDFHRIPVSEYALEVARTQNVPLEDLALYFGGDYELLLTLPEDRLEDVENALIDLGTRLTAVGRVVAGNTNILIKDGVTRTLENRGFEHFRWEG